MKEPIENVDSSTILNIEIHGKLHVLFGGTKVVQHTPPSKHGSGLRGFNFYLEIDTFYDQIFML